MNRPEDELDRLFRAAANGRSRFPEMTAPFGLETQVLAAWHSSRSTTLWETGVLVRGLAFALLLVLASSWPAWEQRTNSDSENLQFADSSVPSDFTP